MHFRTHPAPPMRNNRRKIALGFGALVATVLVALLVLPFLFRDRIASRLKSEINRSVDATVDWRRAGLGLFREFPNVALTLDGLSIAGEGAFKGDTLLTIERARLALALGSVIGHLTSDDRIVVREIHLDRPVLAMRVLPDGRANWDIAPGGKDDSTRSSGGIGLTMRDFRVSNGRFSMDDRHSHLQASLHGLDASLRGDFAKEKFVLSARTRADTASLAFAGIPYLRRAAVQLDADIDADLEAGRFTVTDDTLRLNALVLAFGGSVTMKDPDVGLDLTFAAPSTSFREILSLVPAIYLNDFNQVKTAGTMSVTGRVRGDYGPGDFPSLAIRARVENGAFQYSGLPLPARNVSLDLAIDNPGGDVDSTVIELKQLRASIGGRPLAGSFVMRTPVSDPSLDLRVIGALDLADVARTVRMEGVRKLAGLLAADIAVRGRMSDMDSGRYDRVAASGTLNVARLALESAGTPHPIVVDTAALRLTPRTAELTTMIGRIGSSDLRATASIDNLLAFALRDEELKGRARMASNNFNLNEWTSDEETTDVIPVPARVDFRLQASADRVTYGKVTAANVSGDLRLKDERVTLDELRMETLRGTIVANGFYETTSLQRPTFDVALQLAAVDIPSAFTLLETVQTLAPVARWAQGTMSGSVGLKGSLGQDMTPVFSALTGKGDIRTDRLVVEGAPMLDKVADALSLQQLRNPAIDALRATFEILDGRLHVQPFVARFGGIDVRVAGSNGIDQSLDYTLGFAVPRAMLGAAATSAVTRLAAQAGKSGADLATGEVVQLGARVTGTVANPTVKANFVGMAASAREAVAGIAREQVETRTAAVRQTVDSAAEAARARARAEADRVIGEAERQAAAIRAEARVLAATVQREGKERADSLLAKATNPAARVATQLATDKLRREADQRAERLVREADIRADEIVARAKQQANDLVPAGN